MSHIAIPNELHRETLLFCASFCADFAERIGSRWSDNYDPKLASALKCIANALGGLADGGEEHGG